MPLSAFHNYLLHFKLNSKSSSTQTILLEINHRQIPVFINEFWTAKQRQANPIQEVSYRACFKPQLPRFFINFFTKEGDTVYDPFNGRGTTTVEAALMGRSIIANDVNPLSLIFTRPRINVPTIEKIEKRLNKIEFKNHQGFDMDLSMFYERKTLSEILSLKNYLINQSANNNEDDVDRWIRMAATNRLTGHSNGFFSVYTLPPNQAVSPERQKKINLQRNQQPEYRDVKKLILKKSKQLLSDYDYNHPQISTHYLNCDASETTVIKDNSIMLTVTSPPFLDVVQYAADNWLRCWFNNIDIKKVEGKITMSKTVEDWSKKMQLVFNELYRITQSGGVVAFEVGEVRNGKIKLEESVVPLGINAGFECSCIIINQQTFTKTANIWGVSNNSSGTNSNRIVVFTKKAVD